MTQRKITVITHGDMDGRACAVIAEEFFTDAKVTVSYVGYTGLSEAITNALAASGWDELWITDLGPDANTLIKIDSASAEGRQVYVCDHHKTSRERERLYPWFFFDENLCGAQVFAKALKMDHETPFLKAVQAWDCWLTHNPDGTPHEWRYTGEMLNRYCLWLGSHKFVSFAKRFHLNSLDLDGYSPDKFLEACGVEALQTMTMLVDKEEQNVRRLASRCTKRTGPDGLDFAFVVATKNIGQLGEYLHQGLTERVVVKETVVAGVEEGAVVGTTPPIPSYDHVPRPAEEIDQHLKHLEGCQYLLALNLEYGQCALRRIGTFDVSDIARKHGGGGHAGAAGFQLRGNWQMWLGDWLWTMIQANEKQPGYQEYARYLDE